MGLRSVLATSVRILRQNPLIWLFSLVTPLLSYIYSPTAYNVTPLQCSFVAIQSYLLFVTQLGVPLIAYHGYLGQPARFVALWREIHSYFVRTVAILIALTVVVVIPFAVLFLSARNLPYVFYQLVLITPAFFFGAFFFQYMLLGMFRGKLDIKSAAQVWSRHWHVKLVLAVLVAGAQAVINLVPVIAEGRPFLNIFAVHYRDISALWQLPVYRILIGLYSWVSNPVLAAIIVSLYFWDLGQTPEIAEAQPRPA